MNGNYEVLCDSERREIHLVGEISDSCAAHANMAIRSLESDGDEDITLFITSPGGSVTAGLSIYDTAKACHCDIATVVCGGAYSMGAFLAACAGTKGKRIIQPNAEIMIHQPSGENCGKMTDLGIQFRHGMTLKKRVNGILASCCGKTVRAIEKDTEKDFFMEAEEAVVYGLADLVAGKPGKEKK